MSLENRYIEKHLYYEENKEDILDKVKKYYQINRNKIYEDKKKYRLENKDKVHGLQKALKRKRKEFAVKQLGGLCTDCNKDYPVCCFDFHHIDPSEKEINLSKSMSKERFQEELKKCILLCANCHRVRHYGTTEE